MIDIHTHPVMVRELLESDASLAHNVHHVFGFHFPAQPLDLFLREMDEAGVERAALLPIDCTTAHGCCIVSNEQIAELVAGHPRFIGFASVDPNLPDAAQQLERAIRSLALSGLKLDPALQRFDVTSVERAYPVYQVCAELRIPLLIHCGMSWAPSGLARLAHPLLWEEVVQSFPQVDFILAHLAWPWVHEATMLAVKYPNVYLDTAVIYSGTPADALRHTLTEQIGLNVVERSLFDKLLFGSNYPRVDIRRSVRGIKALGLSAATERAILQGNAQRLLGKARQP